MPTQPRRTEKVIEREYSIGLLKTETGETSPIQAIRAVDSTDEEFFARQVYRTKVVVYPETIPLILLIATVFFVGVFIASLFEDVKTFIFSELPSQLVSTWEAARVANVQVMD